MNKRLSAVQVICHMDLEVFCCLTCFVEFYVHGTVHLSNTSHINTNEMQLFYS